MKKHMLTALALAAACTLTAGAQQKNPPATLRSVLLQELHDTHDKSDWFVCANVAVANLTPEQANLIRFTEMSYLARATFYEAREKIGSVATISQ